MKIHFIRIDEHMLICKTYRYLKYVFAYNANWLIIVFTIFRVIAVYLPHKANIFCTRKRAFLATTVTFIASVIINLDCIIYIDLVPLYNRNGSFVRNRCWFDGYHDIFCSYPFQWLLLVTLSILPFVALVIGNSMIIYKLVKYNRKRKCMSQDNMSNDLQSMTAMLISICYSVLPKSLLL